MKYLSLSFLTYISFIASNIEAKTIHIPGDYPTIQQGIDSADSGDMVLVAKGNYTGGINMKGGIYLKSAEGPESTIITGNSLIGPTIYCSSLSDTVIIDGFIICNANGGNFYGGGICSRNSNLTIRNNIIRNNAVYPYVGMEAAGGGIYTKGGSALIEKNIIRDNFVHAYWKKNSKMDVYRSSGGGGIYAESTTVTIKNNVIVNNQAKGGSYYGGGISCVECLKAIIFNNLIDSNSVSSLGSNIGSGIYCTAPAIIVNNTIVNNGIDTAHYSCGGGICCDESPTGQDSIVIRNNIIAFDSALKGAGIFCPDSMDLDKVFIGYNDFYFNILDDFYNAPPGVGNFSWGTNRNSISCDSFYNINIDPGFTSGTYGNYYQQNVSGCGDYIVSNEFGVMGSNTPDGKPDTGWVDLGYHYGVPLAIEESSTPLHTPQLEIFPNPSRGKVVIKLNIKSACKATVNIYDCSGRLLKEIKQNYNIPGAKSFELKEKLKPGIYFYKLKLDNQTPFKGKLIII